MWILVLLTIGHPPEVISVHEHAVSCRAMAVAGNNPRPRSEWPVSDPKKRYACFVLDSAT